MRCGAGMALAALVLTGLMSAGPAGARPLRILSLDQCADQYVLALAPEAELILSPRADDPDSWMRSEATGRRTSRGTLEAIVATGPDLVVRYWGGDARLLAGLDRRGIRVAEIGDVSDFDGIRMQMRSVGRAVGRADRAETLIRSMDDRLALARRPVSPDRTALYLTAGGFTAGAGTLVDAIMKAAGYRNLAPGPFFSAVSVERIALEPPVRFVLGFFDMVRSDWRGAGRHPVISRAAQGRTAVSLPAAALSCPAWFSAEASLMLAQAK